MPDQATSILGVLLEAEYAPLTLGLTEAEAKILEFSKKLFAGPKVAVNIGPALAELAILEARIAGLKGANLNFGASGGGGFGGIGGSAADIAAQAAAQESAIQRIVAVQKQAALDLAGIRQVSVGGYAQDPLKIAVSTAEKEKQIATLAAAQRTASVAAIDTDGQARRAQQALTAEQSLQESLTAMQTTAAARRSMTPVLSLSESAERGMRQGRRHFTEGAMLTAVTGAPLVYGGYESIKAAAEYSQAIAHVAAMTDLGAAATERLGTKLLEMAKDPVIRQSPKDLADALYFAASRGLSEADSLAAVRASAIGASAGMGEIKDVIGAVTTVLNAYHMSGSQAVHVTDLLAQAAKDGGAASEDFAKAYPRVIQTAAAMRIPLEQVNAQIAAMTRVGVPATTAATALNRELLGFEKPSRQAINQAKELGTTFAALRAEILDKGLLYVLDELEKKTGGDTEKIARMFGSVNSLKAFLSTEGLQPKALGDILGNQYTAANGAALRANAEALRGAGDQFKALQMEAEAVQVEIGTALLPRVEQLAHTLADNLPAAIEALKRDWNSLGPVGQKAVETLGTIILLLGPLTMVRGGAELLFFSFEKLLSLGAPLAALLNAGKVLGAAEALGAGGGAAVAGEAAGVSAAGVAGLVALPLLIGGGIAAWKAYGDQVAEINRDNKAVDASTEAVNIELDKLKSAAAGNKGAEQMVAALRKQADDAQGDVKKLGDVLKAVMSAQLDIKKLGLDPAAEQSLKQKLDDLRTHLTEKSWDVKVQMDHESKSWWDRWLAAVESVLHPPTLATTTGEQTTTNLSALDTFPYIPPIKPGSPAAGMMGVIHNWAFGPNAPGMDPRTGRPWEPIPGVDIPLPPSPTPTKPGAMSPVSYLDTLAGNYGKITAALHAYKLEAAHGQLSGDQLAAYDRLKAARDAMDAGANGQHHPPTGDDGAAAKAAADETEKRRRTATAAALSQEAAEWGKLGATVTETLGAIDKVGADDKGSAELNNQAKMLRQTFTDIPPALMETLNGLTQIQDKMKDMTGARDSLRGLFKTMFEGAAAKGADTSGFLGAVHGIEKQFDFGGKMTSLFDQAAKPAAALVDTANRMKEGLEAQAGAYREENTKSAKAYGVSGTSGGVGAAMMAHLGETTSKTTGDMYNCGKAIEYFERAIHGSSLTVSEVTRNPKYRVGPDAAGNYPENAVLHLRAAGGNTTGHFVVVVNIDGKQYVVESTANPRGGMNAATYHIQDSRTLDSVRPRIDAAGMFPGTAAGGGGFVGRVPLVTTPNPKPSYPVPEAPDYSQSLLESGLAPAAWGPDIFSQAHRGGEVTASREAAQKLLMDTEKVRQLKVRYGDGFDAFARWLRKTANDLDYVESVRDGAEKYRKDMETLAAEPAPTGPSNPFTALLAKMSQSSGGYDYMSHEHRMAELQATVGKMGGAEDKDLSAMNEATARQVDVLREDAAAAGLARTSMELYSRAVEQAAAHREALTDATVRNYQETADVARKQGKPEMADQLDLIAQERIGALTRARTAPADAKLINDSLVAEQERAGLREREMSSLRIENQMRASGLYSEQEINRTLAVRKAYLEELAKLIPAAILQAQALPPEWALLPIFAARAKAKGVGRQAGENIDATQSAAGMASYTAWAKQQTAALADAQEKFNFTSSQPLGGDRFDSEGEINRQRNAMIEAHAPGTKDPWDLQQILAANDAIRQMVALQQQGAEQDKARAESLRQQNELLSLQKDYALIGVTKSSARMAIEQQYANQAATSAGRAPTPSDIATQQAQLKQAALNEAAQGNYDAYVKMAQLFDKGLTDAMTAEFQKGGNLKNAARAFVKDIFDAMTEGLEKKLASQITGLIFPGAGFGGSYNGGTSSGGGGTSSGGGIWGAIETGLKYVFGVASGGGGGGGETFPAGTGPGGMSSGGSGPPGAQPSFRPAAMDNPMPHYALDAGGGASPSHVTINVPRATVNSRRTATVDKSPGATNRPGSNRSTRTQVTRMIRRA